VGQDDGQDLGGQELQPWSKRSRFEQQHSSWWRQEEIAQPVGDGKALGGLLVGEAPRGDLAGSGNGAKDRER